MKNLFIILSIAASLSIFSAEWEKMSKTEKYDYIFGKYEDEQYSDVISYGLKFIEENSSSKSSSDYNYANTLNLIAISYSEIDDFYNSEKYYLLSIDKFKNRDNTRNTAIIQNSLGNLYKSNSKYDKAIDLYTDAVDNFVDYFGYDFKDYAQYVANCKFGIGLSYYYQSSYDSTVKYVKEAMQIDEEAFGAASLEMGLDLSLIADAYKQLNENDNARTNYKKAINLLESNEPESGIDLGIAYNNFGVFYADKYDPDSAIIYYKKAVTVYSDLGADAKSEIANTYLNLGNAYQANNDDSKAKDYFYKSYTAYKELYGEYDDKTTDAKSHYDAISGSSSQNSESNNNYNNNTYTYTPKKESCLDKAEGCFDFDGLDGCLNGFGGKRFSIMFAGDYMQSAGKYYLGGGLGYFSQGAGLSLYYYWSPGVLNGTTPKYIPLVYSVGIEGFAVDISLDIPSLFDNSYSDNKSAPKPYALGLGMGFKILRFIQIKGQYIWGPGGYLPKGLSLNAGLELFL